MKTYRGDPIDPNRITIQTEGVPGRTSLTPAASQRIINHSPDGFSWGFRGSGPNQLSLALLIDFFDGDDRKAQFYYKDFTARTIAYLASDKPWVLDSSDIEASLANIDEAKLPRSARV